MRKLQVVDYCDLCGKEPKVYEEQELKDIFSPPPRELSQKDYDVIHTVFSHGGGASYPYLCKNCARECKTHYDSEFIKLKKKKEK